MLVKKGLQRAASPLPEREVSSHPPLLPAAAGSKREIWKALCLIELVQKIRTSSLYNTFSAHRVETIFLRGMITRKV